MQVVDLLAAGHCIRLAVACLQFGAVVVLRPVLGEVVVAKSFVGSRSQAGCLKRNTAMDDSIGGS